MRRIGKAFAAATLAGAGMALAVVGVAAPASAGGDLVDIKVGNITLYNEISPTLAANLCGVDVATINALTTGDATVCNSQSTALRQVNIVND